MKKLSILFVAVIFCVSCNKEVQDRASAGDGNFAIIPVVTGEGTVTSKTLCVTGEDGTKAPFSLSLEVAPTAAGNAQSKGVLINNQASFLAANSDLRLWSTNSKQDYKCVRSEGESVYFPVDATSGGPVKVDAKGIFYAIAPYAPNGTIGSLTSSTTNLNFTYTSPSPTTDNCDAQAQQDFMIGAYNGTIVNGEVPMLFQHPLASVRFVAGASVPREITVNSVKFTNICQKVKITITPDGDITFGTPDTRKTFVQTFDNTIDPSTAEGDPINDGSQTKNFLFVPQTCYLSTSTGPYRFNSSNIEITYTDSEGSHTATANITGYKFESGMTYTFKIASFAPDNEYVDFQNWESPSGNIGETKVREDKDLKLAFNASTGSWEKMNIPIKNLVVGQWYELEFGEKLTKLAANAYFTGSKGTYACRVRTNTASDSGDSNMVTYYTDEDVDSAPVYIWSGRWDERTGKGENYAPTYVEGDRSKSAKILFKATAATMYWVWDISNFAYASPYGVYWEIHKYGLTRVNAPECAAVNFMESTHWGLLHSGGGDYGYSTFKTYSVDGTASTDGYLEFHARRGKTSNQPKLNVPLINLTIGKTYKISFTYDCEYGIYHTSRNFGCRVSETPATSAATYTPGPEYQDYTSELTTGKYASFSFDGSYRFTATSNTMYWIWELDRMYKASDSASYYNTTFFRNVKIEEVQD